MIKKLLATTKTGDNDFAEVIKHSIFAFGVLIFAGLMQLILDLVLARRFGADGVGLFYLSYSIIFMLSLLGRLGFNRAVVKYIPGLMHKKDWSSLHGLKKSSYQLTILLSTGLALVTFFGANFIAVDIFHQPRIVNYLRWLAVALPAFSLLYVQTGFLSGLKRVKESVFLERAAQNILAVTFILVFTSSLGLDSAIIGYAGATYLTVFVSWLAINRYLPKAARVVKFNKKTLLLIAVPLLFVDFSNQMTGQLNVMFLGAQAPASVVGIFNAALRISALIGVILTGVNAIATTKISELYARGSRAKLESLASKTAGFALLCGLPLIVVCFVFPGFVLGIFGAEFSSGAFALRMLVIAQAVNLGFGSVVQILSMTGYHRQLAAVTVGSILILNSALCLLLIPNYGLDGAAVAVAASIITKNIILLIMIKKYLGIWSLPFKAIGSWLRKLKP